MGFRTALLAIVCLAAGCQTAKNHAEATIDDSAPTITREAFKPGRSSSASASGAPGLLVPPPAPAPLP